ncbi:hypothetical protein ACLSZN_10435 [Avibacterium avium]|uniref:hypothetical protein n=1 Tax=Avibacterium avium TaxID=751 RepID=UPI003BF8FF0D
MRKILLAIISILLLSGNTNTNEFAKQRDTLIGQVVNAKDIRELEFYSFTQENVNDFKSFLAQANYALEENSIYKALSKLDYHFLGGENTPKKLFSPITNGNITYYYLFKKPTKNDKGISGRYYVFFDKKNKKYWKTATIYPVAKKIVMNSEFTQKDFNDFDLVFKHKYFLKELLTNDTNKYLAGYSAYSLREPARFEEEENNCYAIYRFERKDEKAHLQFDFCVSRNNYQETDKYPYRFGKIVIERLDEPKLDKSRYKVVPYKSTTLPN